MISLSVHLPMDAFYQSFYHQPLRAPHAFLRLCLCFGFAQVAPRSVALTPAWRRMVWGLSRSLSYILITALWISVAATHTGTHTQEHTHRNIFLQPGKDISTVEAVKILFNLCFQTAVKINSSLAAPPVIKPAVFISLGSPCIKNVPLDIKSPPHLPPSFASASPLPAQFVSWSDCLPLPPPQWHLAILICMYMPSLCGPRAGEIDQQCRVLLHVSRKEWLRHTP